MPIKAITLLVLIGIRFLAYNKKIRINDNAVLLFLYVIYNVFATIVGITRGYSADAIRTSTINIIWPAVFLLFIDYRVSINQLKKLHKAFVWLTLVICFTDSLIILASVLNLSSILSALDAIHLGGSAKISSIPYFRSEHMYFYAFFAPYMISLLTMDNAVLEESGTGVLFTRIVAVYAVLMSVLSGMGGIWLTVFIAVIFCVFKNHIYKRRKALMIVLPVFILLILFLLFSYMNQGMVYHVLNEVGVHLGNNSEDAGWIIRNNQRIAMISEWKKYPLFGKGIGSTIIFDKAGVISEQSQSELSYYVMLYQKGVVGIILFFGIVILSIKALLNRTDNKWLTHSFMIGMLCFLVANAFNPYLSNMSTMWILFLPLVIGNSTLENNVMLEY